MHSESEAKRLSIQYKAAYEKLKADYEELQKNYLLLLDENDQLTREKDNYFPPEDYYEFHD